MQNLIQPMYSKCKAIYPDVVLLFRNNDEYTAIRHDAIIVSERLNLPITEGAVSFSFDSLDHYLPSLVKSGLRVGLIDEIKQ